METLIYIFDLAALVAILYYSYANDKLTPGADERGPFRIRIARNVNDKKPKFK